MNHIVWFKKCAHYNESRVTHWRQTSPHLLRIQILSSNWSRVACNVENWNCNSESNGVTHDRGEKLAEMSVSLRPFRRASWAPREFAKFPTQLQLQLCGLKTGEGAGSRRVHLRASQSSRKPQSEIFCRRRRRCRRPTHDVPADTGARRAEWDGAHAVQLQLGQRAIVLREVVQGRPRILSLYAQRRAHGANVPGAWRKRKREFARTRDA